ncbi:MAG: hypothetical protein HYU78_17570 [Rhodocyclales bacterium]|nr:hypothetical protein [Rhodocyclales bacterium]
MTEHAAGGVHLVAPATGTNRSPFMTRRTGARLAQLPGDPLPVHNLVKFG